MSRQSAAVEFATGVVHDVDDLRPIYENTESTSVDNAFEKPLHYSGLKNFHNVYTTLAINENKLLVTNNVK